MPFTQSNLVVDDLEVNRLHANNGHTIGPTHLQDDHIVNSYGSIYFVAYTLVYPFETLSTTNATNRDLTITMSRDLTDVFEANAQIKVTELDPSFTTV
eukprot:4633712-Pleurochrysis_carterae.AAC.1